MELCFFFWLFSIAHGLEKTEVLDKFVEDLIDTWQLRSPTIIYQDDLPELCRKRDWILCLSNAWDMSELAQHMVDIYSQTKHDGLIFLGHGHEKLLKKLADDAPLLLSTNYPIFMPTSYKTDIKLRLDSNVLFYEEKNVGNYELFDIFAVKAGPPIALEVGKWNFDNGMTLITSMNRWDRRTKLHGTTFVNCLRNNPPGSQLTEDKNGNIIGSKGYLQDMLFYITDHLNLKIETIEASGGIQLLDNGSWTGEIGFLQRQEADVVSSGLGINLQRSDFVDFPIQTHRSPITLIAAIPKGTTPNMWVYVSVFGVYQWMIFLIALLLMAMGLSLMEILSEDQSSREFGTKGESHKNYLLDSSASALAMVCLYTLQMGSHTDSKQLAPRFLTITACMLTLIMFVFYTGDITAKMTSGPGEIPVNNFQDVIYHDYRVITNSPYCEHILASSKPGSAMLEVYNHHFEKKKDGNEAMNAVIQDSDSKTLFYINPSRLMPATPLEKMLTDRLFALKLDDTFVGFAGLQLQKDSEFLQIFNHYFLKAFEGGEFKRLYRSYYMDLFTKENFEMVEPQPLASNNVMFCFISLGFGICLSLISVMIEFLKMKICKQLILGKTNGQEDRAGMAINR